VQQLQKIETAAPPPPKPTKQELQELIKKHTIAIEENANDISAYLERAKLYEQLFHYQSAMEDYNHIIDQFGVTEPDIYALRADLHFRIDKNCDAALADLSLALKTDEKYIPAHVLKAKIYEYRNEVPKAVTELTAALTLNPKDVGALLAHAKLFDSRLNDADQALEDLNKVIETEPHCAEAYLLKGELLEMKFSQPAKALNILNLGISLEPHNANLYMARAKLCKFKLDENHQQLAAEDYHKAVHLNPELANNEEMKLLFGSSSK